MLYTPRALASSDASSDARLLTAPAPAAPAPVASAVEEAEEDGMPEACVVLEAAVEGGGEPKCEAGVRG